ncbi:MAG: hypothetical protein OXF98_12205 [Rhodospirillaceae bacterium]|nr:hypothetical protein [Rhodospirillaceae bacterium]
MAPEPPAVAYRRFIAPRYWPTWALLGWMKLAARLPFPWQITLGKGLGRIGLHLAPKTRHVVRRNLQTCFPELSDAERARLLKRHFESVGAAFSEMGLGWYSSTERLLGLVRVDGVEHLERARHHGRGIILLCAHFTSLETSTSILGELFPGMKAVYRPQPNEMIDGLISQGRRRPVAQQIPRDNIRVMVRALRDNQTVAYLADLASRGSHSELIPFFGEPAVTTTTVSRLARLTGATVLTYFFRRLPGRAGYVANIDGPPDGFPSDDVVADTRRLVQRLEDYIRLAPEQYMWTYRRFKGRPARYPDIYRRDA